jgi:uncharacterized protein (DUF885 family)
MTVRKEDPVTESSAIRRLTLLALLAALCASAGAAVGASPPVESAIAAIQSLPFDEFIETSYCQIMLRDPDTVWAAGLQTYYGLESFADWTDLSQEAFLDTCRLDTAVLATLRTYDRAGLDEADQLTYDTYEWLLEDRIRRHEYPRWDYVIGPSLYGAHNLALDLLATLPIDSTDAARDYVTRLEGIAAWMDELIEVFREREAHGVIPPDVAIDMTLSELDETFPPGDDRAVAQILPVYTTFIDRLGELREVETSARRELSSDALEAIRSSLIPAFRKFRAYVETLVGRGGTVGVGGYENADAYYAVQLEHYVTRPITAAEIYDLGQREVARVQNEMRALAADALGWPADLEMADLDARLTAANVPILEGDELLDEYQRLVDAAKAALDTAFSLLPKSDLVITVDFDAPPAYYVEPPIDKSGPGQIVTSLLNFVPYSAYDEPVLMHHEGVPGHHLQLALQRDLDLPSFRRDMLSDLCTRHPSFQAFSEGWALYAEALAPRIGLYEGDPIGALCQKRLELVRLARLVVDAGLNALGWTWDEAAAYLLEAAGRTEGIAGCLRFAAYPAQACGYDVGYLTFLALRQRAMDALGEAFDLKEFHAVILENGVLPMEILERIVDDWIAEKATTA